MSPLGDAGTTASLLGPVAASTEVCLATSVSFWPELQREFVGEPPALLRVELTPLADGTTLLVLDHDGLTDSSTGYGAGWQAFLDGPLDRCGVSPTPPA